jgi:hypothetical protein
MGGSDALFNGVCVEGGEFHSSILPAVAKHYFGFSIASTPHQCNTFGFSEIAPLHISATRINK